MRSTPVAPGAVSPSIGRLLPLLLGALGVGLAWYGQSFLVDPLDVIRATQWYALGILAMLAGWAGTGGTESIAPGSAEIRAPRLAPGSGWSLRRATRRPETWGVVLGLVAIAMNGTAVHLLRHSDYDSPTGELLWLSSLVLTLLAAATWKPIRKESGPSVALSGVRRLDLVLVLGIAAFALCLRLYRLDDWTTGMHGDEGEAGLDAMRILEGHAAPLFRTGWFGQSNLYYWALALTMKLFGTDLGGLRMFSVLVGSLMVVPFYYLVRDWFGRRAALLAALFLSMSDVGIDFSRHQLSNITTPALLVGGFYSLSRGWRGRGLIPFVIAGYLHMLNLHFYVGGRIGPILLLAHLVHLFVLSPAIESALGKPGTPGPGRTPMQRLEASLRAPGERIRTHRHQLLALGISCLLFAGPWTSFHLDHREISEARVREKLIFNHPEIMTAQYQIDHRPLFLGLRLPTDEAVLPLTVTFERTPMSIQIFADGFWPRALWHQLTATLSVLTWRPDTSGVYSFAEAPVAKPAEAALIVLGIAWALWCWRNPWMTLLSLWFWLTVGIGGVLTINAPYMPRLVAILPPMAVFAALPLDKLANEFGSAVYPLCSAAGRKIVSGIGAAGLVALLGVLAWQNVTDYYGRYLERWPFRVTTGQAFAVREIREGIVSEGRPVPRFLSLGAHLIYWGHGANRFLNYGTPGEDVTDASDHLPIAKNGDEDVVFLVWELNAQCLRLLRRFYPNGIEEEHRYGPEGQETFLFTSFRVTREEIQARQELAEAQGPDWEEDSVGERCVVEPVQR